MRGIGCLGLLLAVASVGRAQEGAGPDRQGMQGAWEGTGTTMGVESRATLLWEPVLDSQFLRLTVRIEMRPPDGAVRVFEGHAYYQFEMSVQTGEVTATGTWYDSRGAVFPIRARQEGTVLRSLWGTPATEEGATTYDLRADGTLEVVDSVKGPDGTFRGFGRVVYRRSGG